MAGASGLRNDAPRVRRAEESRTQGLPAPGPDRAAEAAIHAAALPPRCRVYLPKRQAGRRPLAGVLCGMPGR